MQGLGMIEDGFTFSDAEIRRASPRFWWGPRKRAAYDRVLERYGLKRRGNDEDTDHESGSDSDRSSGTTAAIATVAMDDAEKQQLSGDPSWKSWSSSDSSDSGSSSSDSGGSDGGGGGSSE
ncbi:hypothetical protein [Roseomonas rosulenta]|uniref:hypothetical protein n=1 Tax=Roseomonas rosulenta TaxID=2748667 RepID=UPI0018DF9F8D|nr:hypothetical protein [Roseomonas rosulenta]